MRIRFNGRCTITAATNVKSAEVLKVLQDKIDETYAVLQNKYGIGSGDIAPDQNAEQERLTQELADLISDVLDLNMGS